MVWISDSEPEDLQPQASSSNVQITDADENPLAGFKFDQLPTELLVEIFKHARPDDVWEAYNEKYPAPLARVCRHWRSVALDAPTLWSNIYIMKYYTEEMRATARIYLERSKTCPLFLTWFSKQGYANIDGQEVIDDLIIPYADRWQRITLIADKEEVPNDLLSAMELLDFQILRDLEISRFPGQSPSPGPTLCRNAPLLRRCRLRCVPSIPPLPSNLVVLDCVHTAPTTECFNLDPLLEFLPHIAHSLEHLRFGLPNSSVSVTPQKSKIPLQNLKSLLVKGSHEIMEHIVVQNLTYFAAFHPFKEDARKVAEMFRGFSAPALQSIQFHGTPLQPLLKLHNLPLMFPQLESAMFFNCPDESAFADLLGQSQPKRPSSLQTAAKYPPKHRKVESPFPHLKELAISDMANWTSFQAAVEGRLKNGEKSLRTIHLPKENITGPVMWHVTQWLPKQGIKLALYESGKPPIPTPPEFRDDPCNEEFSTFSVMMEESEEWDDEEYADYDYEFHDGYYYEDSDDDDEEEEEEEEEEEDRKSVV